MAAMGGVDPTLPTAIRLDWSIFIFATIAVAFVGLLIGTLEMVVLAGLFSQHSFAKKIIYKFLFYLAVMFIITAITFPIAASMETGLSLLDSQVWKRFEEFVFSITFASTMLQMGFSLILCLIYSGISENLGHSVLSNFFTGKYHSPKEEERVFMFLDMKDSTTAAEKLGHIRYFDLLKDYYADLSDSIIDYEGEVYQYIGDEIVISWSLQKGISKNNCVHCFFSMKADLQKRASYYEDKYGFIPAFKAGLHFGHVTTGEIGALKKEIIFTGDILNTTARIQGLCNQYDSDLLMSAELYERLSLTGNFIIHPLGKAELKGKSELVELVSVSRVEG
ncbi:MAG: adenylate/guanylate cyclase domain-containing protein [Cyclobacteriaceae bacterium]|nr:adenylate/guanylate cyclase domain-containing protein [Cyclobacteriaceae bacterium]